MRHVTQGLSILFVGLVLTACAATAFRTTWKAPDAGPIDFKAHKVAAVVVTADETIRRTTEDLLARELTQRGAVGVASYTIVPLADVRDTAKAKAALDAAGVDGAVALRVVSKQKEVSPTPSPMGYWGAPYYRSLWGPGYWGFGWGAVHDPGYLRTETVVTAETLVYDLKKDQLIWAGMSETINPQNAPSFVKDLARRAAEEMRRQGLIQ